ncbi:MAG: hypothetical protein A2Z83_03715 [Omnitrophica bacterium GWA2_52_8]|nr:MAG: hypothetical protein A2Z83_03715 [Omnitrophica bacterium GWA2_52_8]
MADYVCPLCKRRIARDLVLFLKHTDQHIIDQIKISHPEWVETDGTCGPCAEYYRNQLTMGNGQLNIGPHERQKRVAFGVMALGAGVALTAFLFLTSAAPASRWVLALPFTGAALGFIQARKKTCAFLAIAGLQNMDKGQSAITEAEAVKALKGRGYLILVQAVATGVISAGLLTLLP